MVFRKALMILNPSMTVSNSLLTVYRIAGKQILVILLKENDNKYVRYISLNIFRFAVKKKKKEKRKKNIIIIKRTPQT